MISCAAFMHNYHEEEAEDANEELRRLKKQLNKQKRHKSGKGLTAPAPRDGTDTYGASNYAYSATYGESVASVPLPPYEDPQRQQV